MGAMITKEQVLAQLATVMDPELHIDIVSLGLIHEVYVRQHVSTSTRQHVNIKMTLTTPGCPLAPVIDTMAKDAIAKLPGLSRQDIAVELAWEPAWSVDLMTEEAMLQLGMI